MLTAREVEARIEVFHIQPAFDAHGLHEFEPHPTAAQFLVGIGAVRALRVEHRHGIGQCFARKVVVADDHVHAPCVGMVHLVHRADAAVEGDDERKPVVGRKVDALGAHAIALAIAVGNVEVQVAQVFQEAIDQGHGRGAVHIIVAIDEHLLAIAKGAHQAVNGLVHVLHQEGVVEVVERWAEEIPCRLKVCDAARHQHAGHILAHLQLLGQPRYGCRVGHFANLPFVV
jgi:hypothetical protein